MKHLVTALIAAGLAACTTQLYDAATPPPEAERVHLAVPLQLPERFADAALTMATLGFYDGAWQIETVAVDGKRIWQYVDMGAGRHRLFVEVSQGTPTELGLAATWRCVGDLDHDFLPGAYELIFNRDKKRPLLRIERKENASTVVEGRCRHVSVWSGREIVD